MRSGPRPTRPRASRRPWSSWTREATTRARTALGRFARATLRPGPYALLYVVNRSRNLTQDAGLPPPPRSRAILEAKSHLARHRRGQQHAPAWATPAEDDVRGRGRRASPTRSARLRGPAARLHHGAGERRSGQDAGRRFPPLWAGRRVCAVRRWPSPVRNVMCGDVPWRRRDAACGAGAAAARATPRQAAPCGRDEEGAIMARIMRGRRLLQGRAACASTHARVHIIELDQDADHGEGLPSGALHRRRTACTGCASCATDVPRRGDHGGKVEPPWQRKCS